MILANSLNDSQILVADELTQAKQLLQDLTDRAEFEDPMD